jgi:hypothetical protein
MRYQGRPNIVNLQEQTIVIIGPRYRVGQPGVRTINTTSHNIGDWQSDLSPFKLGPNILWDGRTSQKMENSWQFSKVYKAHLGPDGKPNATWWEWSSAGFANPKAVRYPMGRGAKPEGSWWKNQMLGYIDARKQIYFPLYRDSVKTTEGWKRLQAIYRKLVSAQRNNARINLWDFDAYNHHGNGLSLKQVLNNPHAIMGHAFVVAAMLIYGEDIEPDSLPD